MPKSLLRLSAAASAIAMLLLGGCGTDAEPTPGGPAPTPPAARAKTIPNPETPSQPAADSPEIARAREILAEVARTYRESPALSDTLSLQFQEQQPQTLTVRFAPNNNRVEMSLPTSSAMVIDGTMYVTNALMYDLYLERRLENGPADAIREVLNWTPTYHFAMRETDDVDAYMRGFGLGVMRNPRLRGHSTIVDDAGNEVHRIRLEGAEGIAYVYVDPQRKLVTGILMDLLPGQGQPAHAPRMAVRVEANPVLSDELDDPIAFDPGDREVVHDPRDMEPRPLRAGDRAPNFRFQTAEGETVDLRDLRGHVVVLDFWATWCVPCLLALPHLDRFAQWGANEDPPVKVFAVNTMEHAATPEERQATAERFWGQHEYTMPLVFDRENKAAPRTGHNALPLTVVIDPNGHVARVHDSYKRDLYQILRADTARAIRQAEEAEAEAGAEPAESE